LLRQRGAVQRDERRMASRRRAVQKPCLSNGGVSQGKRLLSQATCERALQVETSGTDLLFGFPIQFGLGYLVGSPSLKFVYSRGATTTRGSAFNTFNVTLQLVRFR